MNEEKRRQRAALALEDYLARSHRRRTPERFAILSAALELKPPFLLETLVQKVAESGLRVSRATVYNSMSLLVSAGLARKVIHTDGRADRWEMCDSTANPLKIRLVCTRCGRTREVRDQDLARSLSLRRFTSFTPALFDLYVSGTCVRCRGGAGRKEKRK